jgi:PAS domain S-box-containing protein
MSPAIAKKVFVCSFPVALIFHRSTCAPGGGITERKLAEETLHRSEARYRDVVEHSVYGVCIVTSDGVATGTNAALLRILGCSSQEEAASVDSVRDVFRYSDQQAQLFGTCRQQGSLQNAEAEWRRRDGGINLGRLVREVLDGGDKPANA